MVEVGSVRVATSVGDLVDTRPSLAGETGSFAWSQGATGGGLRDDPGLLLWSTFLGGNMEDTGEAITLDEAGNVFVAGTTYSSTFPTSPGAYDSLHSGPTDACKWFSRASSPAAS